MDKKLKTDFCGLSFKNPVIVPAGVHGRSGEVIREVSKTGVSGICTKTIVSKPVHDVLPCFTSVKAGMINSVFGSDLSSEYWFTEGIKEAKEGESVVIANLAGFTPEESAELAVRAEKSGADMIMLPTHCPHMGEILSAMFPGMENHEPKLTDLSPMKQAVKLIKLAVSIPVVVKLSGSFSNIVKEWAIGVKEAGADGIACSDAFGPALAIDTNTGQPKLGGPRGVGGLTGPAIMPITLRMVLEIAMTIDLPIIGVGGVTTADDVVQYIMAGATLVGVCTAGHIKGVKQYSKIISDLEKYLNRKNLDSFNSIRGLTVKRIEERKANKQAAVTEPLVPDVRQELCISCYKCMDVCAYDAVEIIGGPGSGGKVKMIPDRCIGCGLCVSVCPTDALEQVYYS